MHKACRFRNHHMIKMLLDANIGDVLQRNMFGKRPLEMPHNDICNDPDIHRVFHHFIHENPYYYGKLIINKEPDYIFVVNRERWTVLEDQLDCINTKYEKKKRDRHEPFGLLHGEHKFIEWKFYRHSQDPDKTGIILIHFSDRILNLKAEEIGMRVQL